MVIEMNMRERIARALAGHFGPRKWEDMPKDRADLKARFRAYDADINEPTQDDCLLAADAVLDALMEPDEGMLAGACDKHVPGQDMSPEAPRECPRFETRRRIWAKMLTAARSGRSGER